MASTEPEQQIYYYFQYFHKNHKDLCLTVYSNIMHPKKNEDQTNIFFSY